ncbi:dipeptidase [Embleya sp. NPDC059237]|uniref:dipeptidase n=1 Tax=Embleya sp. NPDC059237 TaxID=3346784 RepID=UPI0036CE1A86
MTAVPSYANPTSLEAFGLSRVVDGHNDHAWASRLSRSHSVDGLDREGHGLHTDLPKLRAGGVGGQFWSVYAPSDLAPAEAVQYTLEQIDFVHRFVARYPQDLVPARTGHDVRAAWSTGRIACLLGAEGGNSIGGSLGVLRVLASLGLRYLTLTHNVNVDWADSATDVVNHGGLSEFGRDVVREMNRLGVLVDLAHVSTGTMRDAIAISDDPVVFSHSSCATLCPHPRNVPDDVLASLAANGGVLMVAFVPMFLSSDYRDWFDSGKVGAKPVVTVADVADHVEHARESAGIAHIGLGSDYDGFEDFPVSMGDVSGFAPLIDCLADRGWSASELAMLMGGNILRVLDDVVLAQR